MRLKFTLFCWKYDLVRDARGVRWQNGYDTRLLGASVQWDGRCVFHLAWSPLTGRWYSV